MVPTARVNGFRRIPRQHPPAHETAALGGASGGVWSWVDAVPEEFKRVVELRAVDVDSRRQAPGIARRAVGAALADWGLFDLPCPDSEDTTSLYDTAATCTSELVTNSVVHVKWKRIRPELRVIRLSVLLVHARLLVEVGDPAPVRVRRPVTRRQVSSLRERGRGVFLVGALVALWGGSHSERDLPGGGKAAWFEVPARAGP
jgi:hypothetical protein